MSNSSKVLKEFSDVRITGKVTQSTVVSATESLTAAATLDATDSGKIFFLNLAGGFTTTLPAPEAGLALKFIVATAPTTAYIISAGSALIHGLGSSAEDATGAVDNTSGVAVATINLVAAKAQIGDCVDLISDGSKWFANATVVQQDAVTFV